jgi:5-methyltetrahydropteroyltriglutamate--homocysteine methyltransferase
LFQSYDVGSLPFFGDIDKFLIGADNYEKSAVDESAVFFEKNVIKVFLDKLKVGVDIPNFPQFRDMSEMFLSMLAGVERLKEKWMETEPLTLKPGIGRLPEVAVIQKNAHLISEEFERPFRLKVCVTGPYTLASFFPYHTGEVYCRLGEALSEVVEENVFCEKVSCVGLVAVDEPLFGLVDDPLIDHGSVGRENLLHAWEEVFHSAKAKKAQTCLHLHSTSNDVFWNVEALDIVESHVDDPLYELNETKKRLEAEDKVLKASACVVDFDRLIREKVARNSAQRLADFALNEAVAEAWKKIQRGAVVPEEFLESVEVMKRRLTKIVERFGAERVPFVGPECGLRGFPSYACAVECLRRVAEVGRSLDV